MYPTYTRIWKCNLGNCTQNAANILESVQVEAGRIITELRVNSSRSKLYSALGWEPLYFCTRGLRVSVSKYMEVVHIAMTD